MSTPDLAVVIIYLIAVVGLGSWLATRSRTSEEFMVANRSLPGWAVGLSVFGTYLSSNTFLGIPGRAYTENWNYFVFSLSLPLAGWIAVRYFIPFYRRHVQVSAYEHLETRFGSWARTYAVVCYLLLQVARTATILYGVSLALVPMTGWSQRFSILLSGGLVTVYTLLGGIEAVIWTDVVQSIVLLGGAVAAVICLLVQMPDRTVTSLNDAIHQGKLSLGSWDLNWSTSTVWVVLVFGILTNLTNFGIDQSFVQRYLTARDERAARRSVWMAVWMYVPTSLSFFLIGTLLFAFYRGNPEKLEALRQQRTAIESSANPLDKTQLREVQLGDHVFPHFIMAEMPRGISGLLIAAILAAAMSSIDTSLNSSATVFLKDVYSKLRSSAVGERESMAVLHLSTIGWGVLGTGFGHLMIGTSSVLKVWWDISGVIAGAMLGLFLLGFCSRSVGSRAAAIATSVGILVLIWFSMRDLWKKMLPGDRLPASFDHDFHPQCSIALGTGTILLAGWVLSFFLPEKRPIHDSGGRSAPS